MEPASLAIIGIIVATLAIGALRRFELTPVLVLSNMAIFFVELFAPAVESELAFSPSYLVSGQSLYTIFTSMFIHASILHVLGNMLFLFFLGSPLEARIGKARFALVYFASGLLGAMVFSLIHWDSPVLLLGASGAISGLVGALLVLYPRDEIPMFLGPIFLPKVPVWAAALSWLVFDVLLVVAGVLGAGTAWEAHVGGLMAGLLIGLAVGSKAEDRRQRAAAPRDYSALEPLATTPQLKNALETIKTETHKDVRKAWLEYFADHAQCPQCRGKMKYKGNKLVCPCGVEVEIS
jgi:membrane associated rhomboid family serine protease